MDEEFVKLNPDSILDSIKILLDVRDNAFDDAIRLDINSVLMVLNQLKVGPDEPFLITGNAETWHDFLGDNKNLEAVKSYVYLKVRLLFDPPNSGVLHEAMERQITEYEFRLNVQAETPPGSYKTTEEEDDDNEYDD